MILMRSKPFVGAVLVAAAGLALAGCDGHDAQARKRIAPEYDKKTGKLTLLKYDSNGNGKVDTWSYMDGARVVRIEIDKDENGTIDRWEYYGDGQKLEKIGFSRANDGKEDAWSYPGADGKIERIEISTRRDGKVSRTEHYTNDVLVAAEEDTDGDGRPDKWETYVGQRLASVAFDTTRRGTPRVEVDAAGTGRFVAAPSSGANPRTRIPNPE
jgi:hypothetical protein